MSDFVRTCPSDIFYTPPTKDGVIQPKPIVLTSIVGNGQILCASASGKKLAIIWLFAKTGNDTANGSFIINSGGTAITSHITCPKDSADEGRYFPPIQGLFHWYTLLASDALTVDVGTQPVNFSGQYIEYTP